MSKLTNCQITARIRGMEAGIQSAKARGDVEAVWRKLKLIDAYQLELKQREENGLNPGAEIQQSHIARKGAS